MDKRIGEVELKREIAAKKFYEFGNLGVTAEDHKAIGSTPPKILIENPGKSLGGLMSDEEIISWLERSKGSIASFVGKSPDPYKEEQWKRLRGENIEEMKRTLKYLEQIERLPKDFKNFNVGAILPEGIK